MAAPTTSYLNNANDKITLETTDANENLLSAFDSLIASYIYGAADIKALFYLDAIYEIEVMAADEVTVIRKGFIGVVENDPNSFNYKHHNAARFFHVQFDTTTSAEVFVKNWIAFNDAGLNTKGDIPSFTVASALDTGGFKWNATYKSAYYIACDIYVRFKKNQESTWKNTVKVRTVAQNTTFLEQDRFWNLDDYYTLSVGQMYDIELYISNSEGEIYTGVKTVTITPYLVKMRAGSNPANAYNSSTIINVYPSTRNIDIGTILYEDYSNQLRWTAGHYMHEDSGIYYILDLNGVVTSKGFYSPTTNVGYTGSVTRLSSGAKFGDYVAEFTIANGSTASEIAPACAIEIGKLNGSGVMTEIVASHTFPAITVPAQSTSERSATGFIEETYAGFTWGYRVYKNGVLIGSGNL